MNNIGSALSYDMKAQIARDLSIQAPTIDEQTALVDKLPINVLENYFLTNIFKTHVAYDIHGHNIIIPKTILEDAQNILGSPYDDNDIEHLTYIAADADLENCESDKILSQRVIALICKNLEDRRNGLF